MPRYFFSIRYRDRVLPDAEGIELGSDVDLEQCALYLADRLQGDDALVEVQFAGCVVEVADTRGSVLLSVPVRPT